ncbi:glycosyltransferase family 9 protein [Luteibaculum oceani]|uniref:Glycosyltransferase family 9 protein n=1 Tax=Luteibaculum oceani TaxID=1294296 RepID=A0A5C6UZX6_9FLAO|nr:glycosyltransferase family 9 protein [Luteibaculum oceani]TXC78952.1 glycosyltransferase family 9 protein [Luteibaculum oceani]
MMSLNKVLFIRFSSIGDIVLTSPVVRCFSKAYPNCEIHFLTKKSFSGIVKANPFVHQVYTWEDVVDKISILKKEGYDAVIDLHKNVRSSLVKRELKAKSFTFDKLNYKKWLYVNFKKDVMPDVHIVDRYFSGLKKLGLEYDGLGLDYYYGNSIENTTPVVDGEYTVLVLGAAHYTKQIPDEKVNELLHSAKRKVVLLGGKAEADKGKQIAENNQDVKNLAGKLSLDESARVIEMAHSVISSDTGMMHIAAAFKKKMAVLWGNTTPKLGMYPFGYEGYQNFEVDDLKCRPCSKIGKKKCPKKHFKCMLGQDVNGIWDYLA